MKLAMPAASSRNALGEAKGREQLCFTARRRIRLRESSSNAARETSRLSRCSL